MIDFTKLVKDELVKARKNHGPQASYHEGYAVILEELDEVWDEVKKRTKERDLDNLLIELIQVSSMAQKMAEDIVIPLLEKRSVKNK